MVVVGVLGASPCGGAVCLSFWCVPYGPRSLSDATLAGRGCCLKASRLAASSLLVDGWARALRRDARAAAPSVTDLDGSPWSPARTGIGGGRGRSPCSSGRAGWCSVGECRRARCSGLRVGRGCRAGPAFMADPASIADAVWEPPLTPLRRLSCKPRSWLGRPSSPGPSAFAGEA